MFLLLVAGSASAQKSSTSPEMSRALLTFENLVKAQHPVAVSATGTNSARKKIMQEPTAKAVNAQIQVSEAQRTKNAFLFVIKDSQKKLVHPRPKATKKLNNEQITSLKAALGIDH